MVHRLPMRFYFSKNFSWLSEEKAVSFVTKSFLLDFVLYCPIGERLGWLRASHQDMQDVQDSG